MSQLSYTNLLDGDQPQASGFNTRFLLAINLLNSGVESDNIANSAVTAAKISSGAVTGSKIAMGSDAQGDILYRGASSYERLAAGTSGQFLKTNGSGANPSWGDAGAIMPRSSWRNMVVSRTNSTTVAVTADELILQDGSNNSVRATSVSVSPAITTSGANGLDTGSETANTIYYIWVIRKSSDGTVAGLISTSSSSPTMPSGYDQKALVSAVGNDNSSNFINFKQNGKQYRFTTWGTIASGNAGTGSWVSVDLTPANMSTNAAFVPSALSTQAIGTVCASDTAYVTNDNSIATGTTVAPNKIGTHSSSTGQIQYDLEVLTSDTLYWISNGASAVLYLAGFEINKLQ